MVSISPALNLLVVFILILVPSSNLQQQFGHVTCLEFQPNNATNAIVDCAMGTLLTGSQIYAKMTTCKCIERELMTYQVRPSCRVPFIFPPLDQRSRFQDGLTNEGSCLVMLQLKAPRNETRHSFLLADGLDRGQTTGLADNTNVYECPIATSEASRHDSLSLYWLLVCAFVIMFLFSFFGCMSCKGETREEKEEAVAENVDGEIRDLHDIAVQMKGDRNGDTGDVRFIGVEVNGDTSDHGSQSQGHGSISKVNEMDECSTDNAASSCSLTEGKYFVRSENQVNRGQVLESQNSYENEDEIKNLNRDSLFENVGDLARSQEKTLQSAAEDDLDLTRSKKQHSWFEDDTTVTRSLKRDSQPEGDCSVTRSRKQYSYVEDDDDLATSQRQNIQPEDDGDLEISKKQHGTFGDDEDLRRSQKQRSWFEDDVETTSALKQSSRFKLLYERRSENIRKDSIFAMLYETQTETEASPCKDDGARSKSLKVLERGFNDLKN